MGEQKNIPLILLMYFILLFGLGCGLLDLTSLLPEQHTDLAPTPVMPSRTIATGFTDRLLWCRGNVYIPHHSYPSPGLVASRDYVTFANFLGGPIDEVNQLEVLDADTGDVSWQSERFPDYEDFTIIGDRVFVLLNRGSPLNIYIIGGDSQPIHSLDYPKKDAKFYVYPAVLKGKLYIYYELQGQYFLHQVEIGGGKMADPQRIQAATRPYALFLFDQYFFLGDYSFAGSWNSLKTGQELWRISKLGQVETRPVLHDNNLIVSLGNSTDFFLLALNTGNGDELWRTEEEFGANIVMYKNSVYGLRTDAVLVKLDPLTGQPEEEIPFHPASIQPERWAYWLVTNGEELFIYFGDSQEVCALRD